VAAISERGRLAFFRVQHPRHRHCIQLTHRFDALITVEVALNLDARERNFQAIGFSTSLDSIDQRKAKTYVIACESDRVLESDLLTKDACLKLNASAH
jgi:hypothetical protein